MKLLFFMHSLSSGGAERVTTNLANYWANQGWTISIITLAPQSSDFYSLAPSISRFSLGIQEDSPTVFLALLNNIRRILMLRKALQKSTPDVVVSMMSTPNVLLAIASIGIPTLATIGSERIYPPQLPLGRFWGVLRRLFYSKLTRVVALTSESREWLQRNTLGVDVEIIPNAVEWPLSTQPPIMPISRDRNTDDNILLAVGRLDEQKGFDLLIDVFWQLADRHTDWKLVIVGEGNQRNLLEYQINQLRLADRICLLGRIGNVGDWYASADLYVMSSRFEGFPNALVEAMAHGLPVVSFDCDTGPRDIIRHEVDGLLVTNGNKKQLAESLSRLMGSRVLREEMGEQATVVRERFSMEKISRMWERVFNDVVKRGIV